MFVPLLFLLSMAVAEPPVSDGYTLAHSIHDHDHGSDYQRSLSQEYGPPSERSFGSHNSLSNEYGPPNARTAAPSLKNALSYLPPSSRSGISQEYGAPNARSQIASARLSLEYGAPNARSQTSSQVLSTEYGVPRAATSRGISTGNSAPKPRSQASSRRLSTEYGVPSSRSSPSQEYTSPSNSLSKEYGVPSSLASDYSPSTQYGHPEFRTPSEEYGVPQKSFGSRTPSQKYGAPSSRGSQPSGSSQDYSLSSARNIESNTTPRSKKPFSSSRSFNAQSSRSNFASTSNSDSYSQDYKGYKTPAARDLTDTYGVPSARGLALEYGVPSARSDKTSAIISSYSSANARSSPSQSYGIPLAHDSMPSTEYGVPDQYNSVSSQGYSYTRDALNDLLNQEPANYDFAYKVNDYETGSDFGHTESRQDNRAEGTYFVVLPDGTKQVVEYEADERGFKPRISLEATDLTRSGGYDDNASEIARSADGPY